MLLPSESQRPTLYRVHPASFRDGNGDGLGDYCGMLSALPYIKNLSVDGILLPAVDSFPAEIQQHFSQKKLALWFSESDYARLALPPKTALPILQLTRQVNPFSAQGVVELLQTHSHHLQDWLWCTGDRDQARIVSLWGQGDLRSAKAFMTLLALLPAPISFYQGEELGLPHAAKLQDSCGAQTPMPWYETPEQATSEEIEWYTRIASEHRAMAISRQLHDKDSTLHYCQALLTLRHHPAIQYGSLSHVSEENGILRLIISFQDQCIEALINLETYSQVAVPSIATLPLLWQSGTHSESQHWVLAGFSSVIFTQKAIY